LYSAQHNTVSAAAIRYLNIKKNAFTSNTARLWNKLLPSSAALFTANFLILNIIKKREHCNNELKSATHILGKIELNHEKI
jgi:hypothetical protein